MQQAVGAVLQHACITASTAETREDACCAAWLMAQHTFKVGHWQRCSNSVRYCHKFA
jgi:hypothetical protein